MFQNLNYISITCINKSSQILKGIVHIDFLNDRFFLIDLSKIETTIGPTFSSADKNNGHFRWSLFQLQHEKKKNKGEENGATNKQTTIKQLYKLIV